MGKITIQEIATRLTEQNGLSKKDAVNFTNKIFDLIRDALERDKSVKVKGLGTFKIIDVDSRESVNVNTGERVLIEGHNKITFTPDVLMKELVNKPFSQFETIVLNDGVDFKDPSEEEVEEAVTESDSDAMPLVDFVAEEKPAPEDLSDEDIPEWVIEPYKPEPVVEAPVAPEPIAEPEPMAEPEPVVEPEPIIEVAPIVEPEPIVESEPVAEPEPLVELVQAVDPESPEEPEPAEEETSDGEESENLDDDEPTGDKRWMLWLLGCVLALGIGYLLGNYFPFQNQTAPQETVTDLVKEIVPAQPEAQPVQPVAEPVEEKTEAEDAPEAEVKEAPEVKAEPTPEVKEPEVTLDKYEAKDSRVRTGAYRIVGTDYMEKVREGDNLKRIAKRTIGPDMECYLEVFNDLNAGSELKTGQEIKIPKLELKKKKKAQN